MREQYIMASPQQKCFTLAGWSYAWKITSTAYILDGENHLLVTGCGEGKTAAVYLHLLVLHELLHDPSLPRFGKTIPERPVVILVAKLARGRLKAASLDADSLSDAHKNNRPLLQVRDVAECKYSLVAVSPERLTSPEFWKILECELLRKSLVLYAIDEAHVIVPWSKLFRKDYGNISKACTRIPLIVPLLAMTATSQQGEPETNLVRLLGFRNSFETIRLLCKQNEIGPLMQWASRTWRRTNNYAAAVRKEWEAENTDSDKRPKKPPQIGKDIVRAAQVVLLDAVGMMGRVAGW